MLISFDFDCTLGEDAFQKLVRFIKMSPEARVIIITSRNKHGHTNTDLYGVAKRLGINDDDIFFTESCWKWRKIKELGVDMHFDDVPEECELISQHTTCIPVLIWDQYCRGSIVAEGFGSGRY